MDAEELKSFTEVVVCRRQKAVFGSFGSKRKTIFPVHARRHIYWRFNRAGKPKPRRFKNPKTFWIVDFMGTQDMAERLAGRIALQLGAGDQPEELPTPSYADLDRARKAEEAKGEGGDTEVRSADGG